LDYNVIIPELPSAAINWNYGLKHVEHRIEINPETMRPQSQLMGRDWQKVAQETFGLEEK
jgi:hypothetical protein